MNLLTVEQATERLGISPSLVRRYCRQGKFGFKLGSRWVIPAEQIASFIPRKVGRPKKSDSVIKDSI